jgi:hypothetical protein
MKLYYNPTDGEVFYAVLDRDLILFSHSTNIPLSEMHIDELIPENAGLCRELYYEVSLRDANGLGRWLVQDGALYERENWTPEDLL